ncbi:MAG: hypothetical protein SAL70_44255 [Scytonema sp. PMC 1070.18]|nr:hypothetical protein [Scytonema sp. PMC 1070.18]
MDWWQGRSLEQLSYSQGNIKRCFKGTNKARSPAGLAAFDPTLVNITEYFGVCALK